MLVLPDWPKPELSGRARLPVLVVELPQTDRPVNGAIIISDCRHNQQGFSRMYRSQGQTALTRD